MQLALTLNPLVDSDLLFAQQLGVDWIVGDLPAWDRDTLAAACNRVKHAGLHLSGLTCIPDSLVAGALSEQPERAAAPAQISRIIGDAGELGVPTLGYRLPVADVGSVAGTMPGRGGARHAVYRIRAATGAAPHERREALWHNLARFLQQVVPVAEAAGVRLAYRTELSVLALPEEERILDSVDELDRLFRIAPSPCHGLDLDHGFVMQLGPGTGSTTETIRHFGADKRIFAVRLRSLQATDTGALEAFLDEDRVAAVQAVKDYSKTRFEGPLCAVPSPSLPDDTAWRHKGAAFTVGYIRGLLQVGA